MATDLTPIQTHLSKKDEQLKSIIQQLSFPEWQPTGSIFHDLMSCLIEQQIHYRSTKKTFERALNKAEIELLTLENFPLLEEKSLSTMKLSTNKLGTILRVVDFFEQNKTLNWQALEEPAIRAIFKEIKGVGTWTVDMLLLYSLKRDNIFPADDYHLKKIMAELYGATTKKQLKAVAQHWSPFCSYGTCWLLAWKENRGKGLG